MKSLSGSSEVMMGKMLKLKINPEISFELDLSLSNIKTTFEFTIKQFLQKVELELMQGWNFSHIIVEFLQSFFEFKVVKLHKSFNLILRVKFVAERSVKKMHQVENW